VRVWNEGNRWGDVSIGVLLAEVIDDAALTTEPVLSNDSLGRSWLDGDAIRIGGSLDPAEEGTLAFEVSVRPDGERQDSSLLAALRNKRIDPAPGCSAVRTDCVLLAAAAEPVPSGSPSPEPPPHAVLDSLECARARADDRWAAASRRSPRSVGTDGR